MTQVGNRNFRGISEAQVEQIRRRCHTELYREIGTDIGLDNRRVGEVVKLLGIERKRWTWGAEMRPYEALYNILITESHRGSRDLPVLLSYGEFVKFTYEKTCHYCGAEVHWAERVNRGTGSNCTNLDRKDNTFGYSVTNCVVCCGWCNRTKGDRFTYEEFMMLAPVLREIQRMRKEAHEQIAESTTQCSN